MANLQSKTRDKYGFTFPREISDVQIELMLWKHYKESPYKGLVSDPWDHGLRAARALLSPEQLTISPWTEQHFYDWTTEEFCITWGGASCSKSNDYGLLSMLDWITDPTLTYTVMASTTKEMLKVRSYESVIRYFRILKQNPYFVVPGKESNISTALLNDGDLDDASAMATVKSSLRGVAVKEGSKEKARANLQGAHLPYVRMILDELAQMPEAVMEARTNLSIGCRDFRLFGLANPDSFHDLSAQYSEPDDPLGWAAVDEDTEEWRTVFGKVRHHNGFNSPSVTAEGGESKYPYLINSARIESILKENHGNRDAPMIWTMIKGFPPPTGSVFTVLSDKDLQAFHAQANPIWAPGTRQIAVAGLDPAFTSGGDECVLQPGLVGMLETGSWALALGELVYIPIKASDERPPAYQVADATLDWLRGAGVSAANLAVDDSGTQSVASIIQVEGKIQPIRCNFCMRASELPLSAADSTPANKRVADQATEIWTLFAELVRGGQVRGLASKPASQFTSRTYIPGRRPLKLESKADYKKRTGGNSPDEGDAVALCAMAARKAAGLFPGKEDPQRVWQGSRPVARGRYDLTPNYRTSELPAGYGSFGLDIRRR